METSLLSFYGCILQSYFVFYKLNPRCQKQRDFLSFAKKGLTNGGNAAMMYI